jgi:peptide/nickel transport system substrate-binding protein
MPCFISGHKPLAILAAGASLLFFAGGADAQTKVSDRWITVVRPAEPDSLDGCNASHEAEGRIVKQNINETLINKNPADGSLTPRLALSWEPVDPNTWRIKLRQGVTFHDGSPFNAETAKRSLDRTMGKALNCANRTKFFGDVVMEVTPLADDVLQIKTQQPDPILPMRLASTAIVGPNTPPDKFVREPVGTGPYAFAGWENGQQILIKRNDKYWGEKPQAEGGRYIWRSESSVRASMVKIGEADLALTIAAQDANNPQTDFAYLNSETSFLRLDMAIPPLDDKRVRLAMNYAVDKNALIGTIMPRGSVIATQMVMPSIPGHNHALDKHPYAYDPAKAKQLLAEAKAAGVPVDKEIVLLSYPARYPNAAELMEAVHGMYKAVGLNVKIQTLDPGQYRQWSSKPYPENRPPTVLQTNHDNNSGDPVFSVYLRYGCGGDSSTFCDTSFDNELQRVSKLSGEERVAGWQELFRRLYEDVVPDVMLHHMVGLVRVNPRIDFVPDVTSNSEVRLQEIHFR